MCFYVCVPLSLSVCVCVCVCVCVWRGMEEAFIIRVSCRKNEWTKKQGNESKTLKWDEASNFFLLKVSFSKIIFAVEGDRYT